MHTVVTSPSYILPKCAKTREPEDEHCVSWCTSIIHMQPYTLDNPKNHTAPAIHNMRLVWDSKIRRKESLILKFSLDKKEISLEIKPEKYQFNKFYQTVVKDFKGKRKQTSHRQAMKKEENPSCQTHCFQEKEKWNHQIQVSGMG